MDTSLPSAMVRSISAMFIACSMSAQARFLQHTISRFVHASERLQGESRSTRRRRRRENELCDTSQAARAWPAAAATCGSSQVRTISVHCLFGQG